MTVRNSAKAIILREGKLLVTRNLDPWGDWYVLPGGGQRPGETLHEALRRECREEIGAEVEIGPLVAVREYLGSRHEFAEYDSEVHRVEFMFACSLADGQPLAEGQTPETGPKPDSYQTGVDWLPLDKLGEYRLYPKALREWLWAWHSGAEVACYLGDCN